VDPAPPTLPAPVTPPPPVSVETTVQRLRVPMPADRITGWVVTLLITGAAFAIRVVNLGYPNKLVFDETYYAKDAYALLKFGYERNWPSKANAQITSGNVDVMEKTASFIVHPPVGKWLIAAGEHFFGMNSFGWRVAPLVFGTLLILVTIRLVRRVSRSTLIGGLAGLLLTLDGLEFVMSRTALLDIFLAFFAVAAVACLAADRDWFRDRLADHLERHELTDLGGRFGPALWLRPWRIAAGLSFGLALGTKWNALYLLAESQFYAGETAKARATFEALGKQRSSRLQPVAAWRVADCLWVEGKRNDAVADQLSSLVKALEQSPELSDVLLNPAYSRTQRSQVVEALMGLVGNVEPALANTLRLLVDRNRLIYLPDIARAFRAMADAQAGRVRGQVTSATKLTPDAVEQLRKNLQQLTQRDVILETREDPSLLGGVSAQVGSVLYDGSVRTQLEQLRRELKQR